MTHIIQIWEIANLSSTKSITRISAQNYSNNHHQLSYQLLKNILGKIKWLKTFWLIGTNQDNKNDGSFFWKDIRHRYIAFISLDEPDKGNNFFYNPMCRCLFCISILCLSQSWFQLNFLVIVLLVSKYVFFH